MTTVLALSYYAFFAAAECTLHLEGVVHDAVSGETLQNVEISLNGEKFQSGVSGGFEFSGLCPQPYTLEARRLDYLLYRKRFDVPPAENEIILLEPRAVERTDDVVVEAPRLRPEDLGQSVSLNGDALNLARGKNLADALASLPGMSVLRSGNSAKPVVRGQSGARLLLLFDGVRHEGQDWGLDHGPELDPFAAGEIRVLKGGGGLRYGGDALGGVVLIKPIPLLDAVGFKADVQSVAALNGRRGSLALRLDGAPSFLPGFAVRLDANVSKGATLQTPSYPLDNTALEEWNAGLISEYQRGPLFLHVLFRHHQQRSGIFSGLRKESQEDFLGALQRQRPIGADNYRIDYALNPPMQSLSHSTLISRVRYALGSAGDIEATYAYQSDLREEFDLVRGDSDEAQANFELRTHSAELVFEHAPKTLGEAWDLRGSAGLNIQHQENVFLGLPLIPNYRSLSFGVFVIEQIQHEWLDVELGLRYDHQNRDTILGPQAFWRQQSRGALDESDCQAVNGAFRCPDRFNIFSAFLGGVLKVNKFVRALADLSVASRVPTVDEQFLNGTAPSFPVFAEGQPGLLPEISYGTSLGVELNLPWLSGEVSGFGRLIQNYIYFGQALDVDGQPDFKVLARGVYPVFEYRADDTWYYGGDGSLTGHIGPVDLSVNAAWVRARSIENGRFLPLIPADRYGATLKYHAPDFKRAEQSFVAFRLNYVAKQHLVDRRSELAPPPEGYALLGLSLGTHIIWGRQRVRLSAEAQNILNTKYRDYNSLLRYYADEMGLQVSLRVGGEFSF